MELKPTSKGIWNALFPENSPTTLVECGLVSANFLVLLAILPAALEVPALTALSLVAAICCGVIVYDLVHYREERAQVREMR